MLQKVDKIAQKCVIKSAECAPGRKKHRVEDRVEETVDQQSVI